MASLHLAQEILNIIYPVGSIYMSVNNTNPGTLFGGTWKRIAQGRTLMGEGVVQANNDNWCGTTNAGDWTAYAGFTGGEVSHELTVNEMPSHDHYITVKGKWSGLSNEESEYFNIPTEWGKEWSNRYWINYSNNSGGNQKHNNLPPYLVVYIWERTA